MTATALSVREAVAFSVRTFEGGLSDHPDDRGGLTNAGLTWAVYLEEQPRGTRAAFLALTRDEVIDLLTERYALRPGYWRIEDPELRHAVIDYAIHSHWRHATQALQRAVGFTGRAVDGVFGPHSADAVNHADADQLLCRVSAQRLRLWARLFQQRPSQLAFAAGWLNRIAMLLERVA